MPNQVANNAYGNADTQGSWQTNQAETDAMLQPNMVAETADYWRPDSWPSSSSEIQDCQVSLKYTYLFFVLHKFSE